MDKKKQGAQPRQGRPLSNQQSPWALPLIGLLLLAFIGGIFFLKQRGSDNSNGAVPTASQTIKTPTSEVPPAGTAAPGTPLTMEANKAVMVTAELDFGSPVPTVAQALTEIERRYQPDDGQGRTFAILDAYGAATPEGKLHLSLHVSSEKPGQGSLVFRRTGEVLWNSRITAAAVPAAEKRLTVYVGDEAGASWVVDGSGGASPILDAKLRDKPVQVRDFWPDGAEREVTLVYSACGCPVKVMARRLGQRTARTRDLPVIFPDDPPAVQTIARLMGW